MTVDGTGLKTKRNRGQASNTAGESLFHLRSLVITALAMVIGLFVGLAAGVPAGIGAASGTASTGIGVVVGVVSGIAAALVSGLTAAGALNSLVGRVR